MGGYVLFLSFVLVLLFFSCKPYCSSAEGSLNGAELVKEVCGSTSDFGFCFQVLSSDANAGARHALAKELVNAALRLAQGKASGSREIIVHQLNNASITAAEQQVLQRCEGNSSEVISALSLANSDFNADSIVDMVVQMQNAAAATEDCRVAIEEGTGFFTALEDMIGEVIKLCEIGVVSSKYFSALDFL